SLMLRSPPPSTPFPYTTLFRSLRVAHDGLALLVVQRARLREAHAAGVAVEQAHLQPGLDGRDLLGHGGLGGVELAGSAREAARLHHAHEHFHRLQPVHGTPPSSRCRAPLPRAARPAIVAARPPRPRWQGPELPPAE